jgi:DNA-binding NarL/FixJ family response regulator
MNADDISCVLLADRHHGLTEGMCGLLETMFDTVVMVSDEPSLQASAVRIQPSVAVVDLALARGDGLGVVRRLRARCPELKLVLLSQHDDISICRSAWEAGADGFVLKRAIGTQLLDALKEVLSGRRYPPDKTEKDVPPPNTSEGQTN